MVVGSVMMQVIVDGCRLSFEGNGIALSIVTTASMLVGVGRCRSLEALRFIAAEAPAGTTQVPATCDWIAGMLSRPCLEVSTASSSVSVGSVGLSVLVLAMVVVLI